MATTSSEPVRTIPAKYTLSSTSVVASFHTSAKYVVVGLDSGSIHIFSQSENKFVNILNHENAVWSLDVWDDTDTLLAGGTGGELTVWDLPKGTKRCSLEGHTNTVRALKILSPTRAVSASRDCTLRIWNISCGECEIVLQGHTNTIRELAVCDDRAVSASYDGDARVWNVTDRRCLHVLRGHDKQLFSVAFDGVRIATGSLDDSIRIWDPDSGESLAVMKGHSGLVGHLIIVGDELISSSTDGTVRTWSLDNYTELRCISAHKEAVTALACDGIRILSGGSDGYVKTWELKTGKLIQELVSGVDAVWKGGFLGGKAVAGYSKNGSTVLELWALDG